MSLAVHSGKHEKGSSLSIWFTSICNFEVTSLGPQDFWGTKDQSGMQGRSITYHSEEL